MALGDAREGKWRGNWRMESVASTLHTTSECGVSSITTAHAHTSAASSRLNWRPRRFKWTRQFRRKTISGFCAWTITFQTQSTDAYDPEYAHMKLILLSTLATQNSQFVTYLKGMRWLRPSTTQAAGIQRSAELRFVAFVVRRVTAC